MIHRNKSDYYHHTLEVQEGLRFIWHPRRVSKISNAENVSPSTMTKVPTVIQRFYPIHGKLYSETHMRYSQGAENKYFVSSPNFLF